MSTSMMNVMLALANMWVMVDVNINGEHDANPC